MRIKLHFIKSIFVITMLLLTNKHCFAQNIYANGSIDKDSIFAGQTFNYKLDVRMPSDYIIDWSNLRDTLSKNIEVIKRSDISMTPINNSNDVIMSQLLTMTTFDTGYVEIPKIGLKYSKSVNDTTSYTCYTNYMDIYVQTVSIDTTVAYKPIKMPIKQNITFEETIPYAGGAIILAGLILLAIYLIKRFRNKEKIEEIKKENEKIISICMGSTSADIKGKNNEMLKKFPIISICGCQGNCVTKILENRGIDIYKTINVEEILKDEKVSAKDPFRLDNESEQCVEIIKKELNKIVTE